MEGYLTSKNVRGTGQKCVSSLQSLTFRKATLGVCLFSIELAIAPYTYFTSGAYLVLTTDYIYLCLCRFSLFVFTLFSLLVFTPL